MKLTGRVNGTTFRVEADRLGHMAIVNGKTLAFVKYPDWENLALSVVFFTPVVAALALIVASVL